MDPRTRVVLMDRRFSKGEKEKDKDKDKDKENQKEKEKDEEEYKGGTIDEITAFVIDNIASLEGFTRVSFFLVSYHDFFSSFSLFQSVRNYYLMAKSTRQDSPEEGSDGTDKHTNKLHLASQFLGEWFSNHFQEDIKPNPPLFQSVIDFVTNEVGDEGHKSRLEEIISQQGAGPAAPMIVPGVSYAREAPEPSQGIMVKLSRFQSTSRLAVSLTAGRSISPLRVGRRSSVNKTLSPAKSSPCQSSFPSPRRGSAEVRLDVQVVPPPGLIPLTPRGGGGDGGGGGGGGDKNEDGDGDGDSFHNVQSAKKKEEGGGEEEREKKVGGGGKVVTIQVERGGRGEEEEKKTITENNHMERVFLNYRPAKVAATFTMMAWVPFVEIQNKELLSCAWTKEGAEKVCPNVMKLTKLFNRISAFVASEILFCHPNYTPEALTFYIKVARVLKKTCDLHSLLAVMAGLTSTPISRLKNAWAMVDEKTTKSFHKLQNIVSPHKNSVSLRKFYTAAPGPKIPPLPIIQKEIFLCYENSRYLDEEKLQINFQLLMLVGGRLHTLQDQQQNADFRSAHLVNSRSLAQLFSKWENSLSEDEMYEQSLILYPVGAKVEESPRDSSHLAFLKKSDRNQSIDPKVLLEIYSELKTLKNELPNEDKSDSPNLDEVCERRKLLRNRKSFSAKNLRSQILR